MAWWLKHDIHRYRLHLFFHTCHEIFFSVLIGRGLDALSGCNHHPFNNVHYPGRPLYILNQTYTSQCKYFTSMCVMVTRGMIIAGIYSTKSSLNLNLFLLLVFAWNNENGRWLISSAQYSGQWSYYLLIIFRNMSFHIVISSVDCRC